MRKEIERLCCFHLRQRTTIIFLQEDPNSFILGKQDFNR